MEKKKEKAVSLRKYDYYTKRGGAKLGGESPK